MLLFASVTKLLPSTLPWRSRSSLTYSVRRFWYCWAVIAFSELCRFYESQFFWLLYFYSFFGQVVCTGFSLGRQKKEKTCPSIFLPVLVWAQLRQCNIISGSVARGYGLLHNNWRREAVLNSILSFAGHLPVGKATNLDVVSKPRSGWRHRNTP